MPIDNRVLPLPIHLPSSGTRAIDWDPIPADTVDRWTSGYFSDGTPRAAYPSYTRKLVSGTLGTAERRSGGLRSGQLASVAALGEGNRRRKEVLANLPRDNPAAADLLIVKVYYGIPLDDPCHGFQPSPQAVAEAREALRHLIRYR